ncbi:glycoside hydrolase family 43 protein [Rhodocollybia butyracea]|uniref:Arabinan endo-1,5-alpha-L-arabinosidase n=1 Tax=Rhodocollybia butyracea TaxID=206335 RepID=A0A9P5PK33_9AGAR|nr:glycoside hydrolase family 43 protein [Rhodocollybia butyracea]
MLFSFALLAVAALCGVADAQTFPNPGLVTGDTTVADPTMVKDSAGTYFVYSTAPGLQILTSTDRTAFTFAGTVWPNGASWTDVYTGTTNGNLWAPDCTYLNGQFYLYYAASSFGSQNSAIFFATSTTGLSGSFTNQGLVTSTATGDAFNAIDPNLIVMGSVWFLSFGSFWDGIYGELLASNTGKPSGTTLDHLAQRFVNSDAMEASVIFQNGDFFYLFTSWDLCCMGTSSTYSIHVGRSTTYNGNYVDADGVALTDGGGTIVLESHGDIIGPGGQDLLNDVDGVVMVYHYYTSAGTFLGINLLDFSTGWPVVV